MNPKNIIKNNLLEKVKKFVNGKYSVEDFWKDFYIYFYMVDTKILDEYDYSFFLELCEELYHTDFVSPPSDPALKDSKELLSWIKENLPLYLDGKWRSLYN